MLGLYLHIPFCHRKCLYCDFFSIPAGDSDLDAYVNLLLTDLQHAADTEWVGPVDTIYFGGGTPSLLTPGNIGDILSAIDHCFGTTEKVEISLEANPGTVSLVDLRGYHLAGINRLSLGLQTSNDTQLAKLGRLHDRQEGLEAVKQARQAGFNNLSLDLMFALPGQTLADLEEDLNAYLDLAPEHLSCYGLTAEPQTPLHEMVVSGEVHLPDEELYADAFMMIHDRLSSMGYQHYEIANYSKPGLACRHNVGYWQRRPYLGVGAGAHSFHANGWGSRSEVPKDLSVYRQKLSRGKTPRVQLETFDRETSLKETIYLALRTREGIHDKTLQEHFDCTLAEAFPEAVNACAPWLKEESGRWFMTPDGWLLFDHLIQQFL